VVQAGATLAMVEVEPWVLPAGAGSGAEVGGGSPLLVLMLVRQVGGAMMVHHPVPWRGTTGRSCHDLPLLCLLVSMDHIVRDDDIADEFWE
jgi:hypothetical protein